MARSGLGVESRPSPTKPSSRPASCITTSGTRKSSSQRWFVPSKIAFARPPTVEILSVDSTPPSRFRVSPRVRTARAWVGLFAEAVRSRALLEQLRRAVRSELRRVDAALREAGLGREEAERGAAGLVAFVLGALVFGALLLRSRAGLAAPTARRLVDVMLSGGAGPPENGVAPPKK